MAIGTAKASSTSRDGRHMRQEAVVLGAVMASSTARWCGGAWLVTALRWRHQVMAGDPHQRL